MISYDNYKNRIEKLAKVKRKLHKFRFLIAGALTVVLGASVGLMVAKGTYMSDMTLSSQTVTFNEPYDVKPAKAFLASENTQKIEYRSDGSGEWTTQKPVKAGKYYARTVSPKIVGYNYSSPVSFEILPISGAQFTITDEKVTYGETPHYNLSKLLSQHKVVDDGLIFDYADYAADVTEVSVNLSSVKIVDADGEDFTSCYEITPVGKTLRVNQRTAKLNMVEPQLTYNGGLQTVKGEVDGEATVLAAGDTISLKTGVYYGGRQVEGVTNAGRYELRAEEIKVMHGDVDVSGHYNFGNSSTLRFIVARRLATINTASDDKIYDGEPLSSDKCTAEGLVDGHKALFADSYLPERTEVGETKNEFLVRIVDSDGKGVTENYDVTYNYGTLRVDSYKIKVQTPDEKKEYDGTDHYNFDFTSDKTAAFDAKFELKADRTATTAFRQIAGSQPNIFTVNVFTKSGEDVSRNFAIEYEYGTLLVEKRKITVTTGELLNAVYSGTPRSNPVCKDIGGSGLVSGHNLQVENAFTVTDATAAGGVDNETTYIITGRGQNVSENYEITYVYGKIEILPRRITVRTKSDTKQYDGTPLSNTTPVTAYADYMKYPANGYDGLLNGDELKVVGTPASRTDFGITTNRVEYEVPNGNYVFAGDPIYGELSITARKIIVKTASASRQYDATALTKTDGYTTVWEKDGVSPGLLKEGEVLTVDTTAALPEITNFGATPNSVKYIVPNANYEIAGYVDGTLEITAREIIVKTASASKIYDGAPLEKTDGYETFWANDRTKKGLLIDGEILTPIAAMVTSISEVTGRRIPNVCVYSEPNANYKILDDRYENGWLEILPRPIIIKTADADKVYDGAPLTKDTGYEFFYAIKGEDGKWAAGEAPDKKPAIIGSAPVLSYTESITDVGSIPNACLFTHENSEYRVSNYDIHYDHGTLEVKVREIIVRTADDSKVYDGVALKKTDGYTTVWADDPTKDGLVSEDDKLSVDTTKTVPSITDVGRTPNSVKYTVPNGNYKIKDYVDGTLEIKVRKLKVTFATDQKIYDGTPLKNDYLDVVWADNNDVIGLIGKDGLNIDSAVPEITEISFNGTVYVDSCDNIFAVSVPSANYEIAETVKGTLTILPVQLHIMRGSADKIYDGKPLTKPTADSISFVDNDGATHTSLYLSHALQAVDVTEVTNATGDSGVPNNTTFKVVDGADATHDVTGNYNIIYDDDNVAKLVVNRASLKISLYDIKGVTYGETFAYPTGKVNYKEAVGLVNGEQLEVAVAFWDGTNEIGDKPFAKDYVIAFNRTYSVFYYADGKKIENGINNYDITIVAGTLTIDQKKIEITIDDQSCKYGAELPANSFVITDGLDAEGKLPYDESLSITAYSYDPDAPKNVGTYAICADKADVAVTSAEGATVTGGNGNYDITIVPGELEITKRTVNVTLIAQKQTYGNYPGNLYVSEKENEGVGDDEDYGEQEDEEGIVANEYMRVLVKFYYVDEPLKEITYPLNAGKYLVRPYIYYVYNKLGEIIDSVTVAEGERGGETANYVFTCEADGELIVEPKVLEVEIDSYTIDYGDELPEVGLKDGKDGSTNGRYPYNEKIKFNFIYNGDKDLTPKNCDVYNITISGIEVSDSKGNPIKDGFKNYTVTTKVGGTLTINKRAVTYTIDDKTCVYGEVGSVENKFTFVSGVDKDGKLPYGETLTPVFAYTDGANELPFATYKNVGKYRITVASFTEGDGADLDNYDISYVTKEEQTERGYSELSVTPRAITFTLKAIADVPYGETFAYVGEKHNYASAKPYKNGVPAFAYNEDACLVLKYMQGGNDAEVKDVGDYFVAIDDKKCVFYDENGDVILNGYKNYRISVDEVKVKVTPFKLNIALNKYVGDNAKTYGEYGTTFTYPDGLGNYDKDNSSMLPYDEQLKVSVIFNGDKNLTPRNIGTYTISLSDSENGMNSLSFYDDKGAELTDGAANYVLESVENGSLQINKKSVKIQISSLNNVTYGEFGKTVKYKDGIDNYEVALSDALAYGEKIKISVIYKQGEGENQKKVEPQNVGTYYITLNGYTVYVAGADGKPVEYKGGADNYDLSAEGGTLSIIKKKIALVADDRSPEYGEALPENSFKVFEVGADGKPTKTEITNLPYGDKFAVGNYTYSTADGVCTPRNVGDYNIVISRPSLSVTAGNKSVDNYDVTLKNGKLQITPAHLKIQLKTFEDRVYGVLFSYRNEKNNYVKAEGAKYGEVFRLTVRFVYKKDNVTVSCDSAKDAATYKLEIQLRDSFAYGEIDSVEYENKLLLNYVVDEVSDVYVTVHPRAVKVIFDDKSCVYGEALPENTVTLEVNVDDITDDLAGRYGLPTKTSLPYNQTITVPAVYKDGKGNIVTPVNAGTYFIVKDETKNPVIPGVTDELTNFGLDNYTITYGTNSKLTINKKNISYKIDDFTLDYGDGVPAERDALTATGEKSGTVTGEKLVARVKYTKVGEETTENYITPRDVGNYSVVAVGFAVKATVDGVEKTIDSATGNELTNYIVSCDFGTLTIAPREVSVYVATDTSFVYGGEFVKNGFGLKANGKEYALPYGEKLNLTYNYYDKDGVAVVGNPKNAGTYTVEVATATIERTVDGVKETVDFTKNYNPDYSDGKLVIDKFEIKVSAAAFSAEYGSPVGEPDYTVIPVSGGVMPYGETVTLTFKYGYSVNDVTVWTAKPQNAKTYKTAVADGAVTKGGLFANYKVTEALGDLTITPFEVTVTVSGKDGSYNLTSVYGEALPEIVHTENRSLPTPEKLSFTYGFINAAGATVDEPKNADTYKIVVDKTKNKVTGGNALVSNYDITYAYEQEGNVQPTLEIKAAELEITLNASLKTSFVYGDDIDESMCDASVTGLKNGEKFIVAVRYTKTSTETSGSLRRAALFDAQASETKTRLNAGTYLAEIDWDNCKVVIEKDGAQTEIGNGTDNYGLKNNYCAPVAFSILPKTINVSIDSHEIYYGDEIPALTPSSVDGVAGETIELTLGVDGEAKNVGSYPIIIKDKKVVGGNALLSNYDVVAAEGAKLDIKPKAVNITLNPITVAYGGNEEIVYAVELDNYNLGKSESLVNGERLTVTGVRFEKNGVTVAKPTAAGTYDIVLTGYTVHSADGKLIPDGYENYTVTGKGLLTITELELRITTKSASKEYDGTPLTVDSDEYYTVTGTLVGDDKLVLDMRAPCEVTYVTTGAGVANLPKFKVVDGADNDHTTNYKIIMPTNPGRLTITARKVKFVTNDDSKVYDGNPLTGTYAFTYAGETVGAAALADGDKLEITKTTSITNVSESGKNNTVEYRIVRKDASAKDVTDCYYVEYTEHVLQITRAKVTVKISNRSVSYGEAFEIGHDVISGAIVEGETLTFDVVYKNGSKLLTPLVKDGYFALDVTKNFPYSIQCDESTVKINGSSDLADNYDITWRSGDLTISARRVVIIMTDKSFDYDGQPHSFTEFTTEWEKDGNEDGLIGIDGVQITVTDYPELTDAGEILNECEFSLPAGNTNYRIVTPINYGKLIVKAVNITVKSGDLNTVYNGENQSNGEGTLTGGTLASFTDGDGNTVTHKLAVKKLFERKEATPAEGVDNETEYKVVAIKTSGETVISETDVKEGNYKIYVNKGTYFVAKREVYVSTGSAIGENALTYNGLPRSVDGYTVADPTDKTGLVAGHKLTVGENVKVVGVTDTAGEINSVDGFRVTAGGVNVTANYDFSKHNYGRIVVNPAPVTVTLNSGVVKAYGEDYTLALTENAVVGLVNGETAELSLTFSPEIDGAGIYTASCEWLSTVIKDKNGEEIEGGANNYVCGNIGSVTFEITPKSITLTILAGGESSFIYGEKDGANFKYDVAVKKYVAKDGEGNDVFGENGLTVAVKYYDGTAVSGVSVTPRDAHGYTAVFDKDNSSAVIDGKAVDLKNFDISCNPVSFEIKKKQLKIKMNNINAEYGEMNAVAYPTGYNNYRVSDSTQTEYGEEIEVTAEFRKDGSAISNFGFAGTYDIVCTGIAAVNGGLAGNYEIVDDNNYYGKLVIKGINLEVTRKTVKKTYDGTALVLSDEANADEVTFSYVDASNVRHTNVMPDGFTDCKLVLDKTKGGYLTADGNAQTIANTAVYIVVDGEGNQSGEFVITHYDEEGGAKLVIEQKQIDVNILGATKEYDKTALTAGFKIVGGGAIAGHTVRVKSDGTTNKGITNVGTKVNDAVLEVVVTGSDADVSQNYKINYLTRGTLEVTQRIVKLELADMERQYGEAFGNFGYDLYRGANKVTGNAAFLGATVNITVHFEQGGAEVTPVLYDGYYLLNKGEYSIEVYDGDVTMSGDDLNNFDIDIAPATLTITARRIIVVTDDKTQPFNGDMLHVGGYTTKWENKGENGENLPGLLGVTLNVSESELEANGITYVSESGADNRFTFTAPSDNYEIVRTEYGKLTISKRSITIVTGSTVDESGNKVEYVVYDGKAHSNDKADRTYFDDDNALEGVVSKLNHKLKVVTLREYVDANYPNGEDNDTTYTVVDASGSDVTGNYELHYNCGKIIIKQAELTIKLALGKSGDDLKFAYGYNFDAELKAFDEDLSVDGLVNGEHLTGYAVKYLTTDGKAPKNVGEYKIALDDASLDIGDKGVKNYNIVCDEVTFEIVKKKIALTLSAFGKDGVYGERHVYDGELTGDFENDEEVASLALDYVHKTTGAKYNSLSSTAPVGEYTVSLNAGTMLLTADGFALITANYDIYADNGAINCNTITYEIKAGTVTVNLADVSSREYDGEVYDYFANNTVISGMAEGESATYDVVYKRGDMVVTKDDLKNAGVYTVEITESSVDLGDNYVLAETGNKFTCTVEITPRKISVMVFDRTVEEIHKEYTTDHISVTAGGGKAGFVGDDLTNAGAEFVYTKVEGATLAAGELAHYSVSVRFTNDEVMKNYELSASDIEDGKLIVTKTKVSVKATVPANVKYGDSYGTDDFGYTDNHIEADGKLGDAVFTQAQKNGFKAQYRFENTDSGEVIDYGEGVPVNAGTYKVKIKLLNSDNSEITDYFIEYEDSEFTIARRKICVEVKGNDNQTSFVYDNKKPDLSKVTFDLITEGYDNYPGNKSDFVVVLIQDNKPVTSYDAGVYMVGVALTSGAGNYEINVISDISVEITKRLLVIGPNAPEDNTKDYDGTNWKLGEEDYVIVLGSLADGDKIAIESEEFAPTKLSFGMTIKSAIIYRDGDGTRTDVSDKNYRFTYKYDRNNTDISENNLNQNHFRTNLRYNQINVEYVMGAIGANLSYAALRQQYPTATSYTHTFDPDGAVTLADSRFTPSITATSYTVPLKAGVTKSWLNSLLKIYWNGVDITAICKFDCTNAAADGRPITINASKINIVLASSVTTDNLKANSDGSSPLYTLDGIKRVLNSSQIISLTGLYKTDGEEHFAEVYVFEAEGKWTVGVSVYSLNGSNRVDMSANYEIESTVSDASVIVKLVSFNEITTLSKTAIRVKIDASVTDTALASGKDNMFTATKDGNWELKQSLYNYNEIMAKLQPGHEISVFVYKRDATHYALGVVIYTPVEDKDGNYRRQNAAGNYNTLEIESSVTAKYLTPDQATSSNVKRELFIDFNGVAVTDGVVTYTVSGGNQIDGHTVEVVAVGNIYKVRVFAVINGQKVDRSAWYTLVSSNVPAGVTVTVQKI